MGPHAKKHGALKRKLTRTVTPASKPTWIKDLGSSTHFMHVIKQIGEATVAVIFIQNNSGC